jgi:MFS transporter, SP family, general alpha glucoside:H+ symporter
MPRSNSISQVGSILGLYINGIVSDWIGYKKTMLISLIVMIAFLFIPFFSQNVQTFVAGAVLQGIPWGIFQTLTVTYASEICPTALRPILTTYVNLCWVFVSGLLCGKSIVSGF